MSTNSTLARFTINLSLPVNEPVSVEWQTSDGTAKAGIDYASNKGTVIFAPGEVNKEIDILIYGRAVGAEDRSFYVEMTPPANAILGKSIGECIIHVDTTGSSPVTQVIIPTGPKGDKGDSGDPADIQEVADAVTPLIDVGESQVTAEGTGAGSLPLTDRNKMKTFTRRIAYASQVKVATCALNAGDNTIGSSSLSGDAIDLESPGTTPRLLRAGVMISPSWSVEPDGRITIKSAAAGDVLYLCQYDFLPLQKTGTSEREQLRRSLSDIGLNLVDGSFETGATLQDAFDAVWHIAGGQCYTWGGGFNKNVPAKSNPGSTGGVSAGAWSSVATRQLIATINAMRNEIVVGVVFPPNANRVAKVGDVVPAGVTHLRTKNGLLALWDANFMNSPQTLQVIPDNDNGFKGYNVITNNGTFEFIATFIKTLRDNNNIEGYGVDISGSAVCDAQLQKIALRTKVLNIRMGQRLRFTDLPSSFEKIMGGGRMIYDTNPDQMKVFTMPSGFTIEDIEIETVYRNRLAIKANWLSVRGVREIQSDTRTDQARFNAVEWQSETSISISDHETINTGLRFLALSNDCSLSVNNAILRVNHTGEGPDGNNHGVDGIKVSGGMRSININNIKCFGTSRDIIDTYIGGGECNITNIWADGFYFNQIEIKSQGTASSEVDTTPHDINISNVICRPGGLGSLDTFAAIMFFNQSEGDDSKAPRRVNISNYTARRIGLAAAGTYHGLRAQGAFDINLSNVNLLQAKAHGINATRCRNLQMTSSNIHGVARGMSISDSNDVTIIGSSVGKDEQSGDESPYGVLVSGTSTDLTISGSDIIGSTRSLSAEGATINEGKFNCTSFNGPVRIDNFADLEFSQSDINARSAPTGNVDCFLSNAALTGQNLKFLGGKLKNGRRGLNEQGITYYSCLGTTFENLSSPMAGKDASATRIVVGCFSKGAGAFPVASGTDQIANNTPI